MGHDSIVLVLVASLSFAIITEALHVILKYGRRNTSTIVELVRYLRDRIAHRRLESRRRREWLRLLEEREARIREEDAKRRTASEIAMRKGYRG